jgi:hypothetical protein
MVVAGEKPDRLTSRSTSGRAAASEFRCARRMTSGSISANRYAVACSEGVPSPYVSSPRKILRMRSI